MTTTEENVPAERQTISTRLCNGAEAQAIGATAVDALGLMLCSLELAPAAIAAYKADQLESKFVLTIQELGGIPLPADMTFHAAQLMTSAALLLVDLAMRLGISHLGVNEFLKNAAISLRQYPGKIVEEGALSAAQFLAKERAEGERPTPPPAEA